MAGERLSQRMKEQILELASRGIGKQRIALMLGISKNTVKRIVRQDALKSHKTVSEIQGPDAPSFVEGSGDWRSSVRWEDALREYTLRYVTIKCLHQDFAPDVSYWSFWHEFKRRTPKDLASQARVRIQHKPGSRVELDYCEGIPIVDRKTGKVQTTQFFCGVSSFSDYTFGEFVMSQRREEFIASQDRMHAFFGGIFEYVVIDNLKSGMHRAHHYDPDVNPVYLDYANYNGFAVLPARPRTPRDKPAVEAGIGVIQRQFFAEMRNRTFYSLAELNAEFRLYLVRLNNEKMKDHGVSRMERFNEEKPLLKPIKQDLFEIAEYRTAKVHPDCHIQVEKNYYSVPYQFIGQEVRVRLTPKLIEVFNSTHESIAVHSRQTGIGKFSTVDTHYPEQKVAAARFDLHLARKEAQKIGPEALRLVEHLIEGAYPLKYLRRIQGIVRLKDKFSPAAINYGCHQAMVFGRPRLQYIMDCAKNFERIGAPLRAVETPERELSSVYLQNKNPNKKGELNL